MFSWKRPELPENRSFCRLTAVCLWNPDLVPFSMDHPKPRNHLQGQRDECYKQEQQQSSVRTPASEDSTKTGTRRTSQEINEDYL